MQASVDFHPAIMSDFATYRTFTDPEEADALVQFLDHRGIPYRIDRARPPVDMSFDPDRTQERILIFLPRDLFAEADRAQEAAVPDETESSLKDHYLSEFSDEELLEILYKSHEWSPGDVVIARRLLESRGVEVDSAKIAGKREELVASLREPVKGPFFLITAGFLLALIGGLLGIALGWSFATFKDRDPDGHEFYKYDEKTRTLGKWMMSLGAVSLLMWLL
jgi:hypothetical protein